MHTPTHTSQSQDRTQLTLDLAAAFLADAEACEYDAMLTGRVLTPLEELGCAALRAAEASRAAVVLGAAHTANAAAVIASVTQEYAWTVNTEHPGLVHIRENHQAFIEASTAQFVALLGKRQ